MNIRVAATRVAAMLLLAACDVAAIVGPTVQPIDATSPTARPATAPPSTEKPAIDLASIIVAPEAPPTGMQHDESGSGRDALTMLIISGRGAEFDALDGFVDARWATFSGNAGALLSLAMAFDDSLTGDLAYHRFVRELSDDDGYGFGTLDRAALGFEGVCDTGANPAHEGLVETICIWREGSLVLIAGGPMPPDQLKAIAVAMDARTP